MSDYSHLATYDLVDDFYDIQKDNLWIERYWLLGELIGHHDQYHEYRDRYDDNRQMMAIIRAELARRRHIVLPYPSG